MSTVFLFPIALLLVGASVLLGLTLLSWQRRSATSPAALPVLLGAATIWVLGAALEHVLPTLDGKILATQIQYVGIVTLPTASLVTVLSHVRMTHWIRPCLWTACPISFIGISLVATNAYHGWVWSDLSLLNTGVWPLLKVEYGPAFWAINIASHSQLVLAAVLLFPSSWQNWRAEATFAYIGFTAPWVANLAYVTGHSPIPNLDITPFGLVITGMSFSLSFHGAGSVFSTVKLAHRDVIESISDLVLVIDRHGRLLSANRRAREALDTPALPAPATTALAKRPNLLAAIDPARNPSDSDIEIEIAGESRVFDLRSVPVHGRRGQESGSVIVMRDVTEQRNTESDVRTHRQQLRQIIDLIPHPIYVRDEVGRFVLVNDRCARAYGVSGPELEGLSLSDVHSDDAEIERILANDRQVIESQGPLTTEEPFFNGQRLSRIYKTTKVPFSNADSEIASIVAMSIDVTEERERGRMLEFLASTDPLTNLPNRRHFGEVLGKALSTVHKKNQQAALLCLDLDRFKMVNDNYGHPTGDEVLRQVAERIHESVRFSDHIARTPAELPDITVSRLGGDEFMVLLPTVESSSQAALVARRLIDALEVPFDVGSDRLRLGTSIGIAICPEDGTDSETLIRHCDQALTNAKRTHRGRFEFYNAAISGAEERRHALEQGLRQALERGELTVHYQPIRDARNGQLTGAEALVRWTSPELGQVGPDEFIPVAEESGLVVPLGLEVLRAVCMQMADWQARHLRIPQVSVNLSARQLVDGDSYNRIHAILNETGISGAALEFELTEGSVLSDNPNVEATLAAIQDFGSSLALDDFGTGFSSLSHLRRFSFQRLKIDRSFVSGLGESDSDEELTRAIIALANQLNIQTVAEGVETEAQLEFLRREGCDDVQGYLLGRPEDAETFERLLDPEKPDDIETTQSS